MSCSSPTKPLLRWDWSLDDPSTGSHKPEDVLSADEVERMRRFATPMLQRRFLAARAGLRRILGTCAACDPLALRFELNPFGKPSVIGRPTLRFSLSHSADRAFLVVSEECDVGADIEAVRQIEALDLSRRYFHPGEVAAIEGTTDQVSRLETFFAIWTLKEAVVKAMGTGLSTSLDSFEVSLAQGNPVMRVPPPERPGPWWLHCEHGAYCRGVAVPSVGPFGLIQRTV